MAIETLRYTNLGLENPVGIIGFPSVGLVSSIAANFYVSELKMTPIAGITGPGLPPYSLIADGVAYPPIRMYGLKGTARKRDVIVCTSEYAPKPDDCFEIATNVLFVLRDLGCTDIICLEGIPRTSEQDSSVVCGNGPGSTKMVESSGLQKMDNGMIKGVSGIMMYYGGPCGMNITTVMCPGNPNMPDPGSAIGFIEPLSKMVKGLKVNPKTLEQEAEEVRRRMEAEQAPAEMDPAQSAIYG